MVKKISDAVGDVITQNSMSNMMSPQSSPSTSSNDPNDPNGPPDSYDPNDPPDPNDPKDPRNKYNKYKVDKSKDKKNTQNQNTGKGIFGDLNVSDTTPQVQMPRAPNNTFGALFGSSMPLMGQVGVQRPVMQPMAPPPIAAPQIAPAPQIVPPMAPQQMPPAMAMSDIVAKMKITNAHKEVDTILQKIYDGVIAKKGKK